MSASAKITTPSARSGGRYVVEKRAPGGELNITQKLIDTSIQRASGNCMIAEAVKARFPWASRVDVDLQTIRFSNLSKRERYTFLTPRTGQIALVLFDQGLPVEPFKLRLRGGSVTTTGQGRNPKARGKTTIVQPKPEAGEKPVRVGGRTPPRAGLSNRPRKGTLANIAQKAGAGSERIYGVRSLNRIPELNKE